MTEWKLFDGDVAHVSTFDFHSDRERAPHWEQSIHRPRLEQAVRFVLDARQIDDGVTKVVDLGCGDGGLIAHLNDNWQNLIAAVGYDFQPSNIAGWTERGLVSQTFAMDFVKNWTYVIDADVYVITECLEHLTDPHMMLRNIRARGAQLVCSSPWTEHYASHDECHAWAWDFEGYEQLVINAGFAIREHVKEGMFQVIWAVPI